MSAMKKLAKNTCKQSKCTKLLQRKSAQLHSTADNSTKVDNIQLNVTKHKCTQLNAGKRMRMQVTILRPTSKKSVAAQLAHATHAGAHRNP